jgi:kinesin family protein 5
MSNAANVNVICRFRPMNDLERTSGNEQVCEYTSPTSLTFHSSREKNVYRFNFDRIFPPSSTQQDIYDFGVKGIIDSVLDGYNGTVLAYGQTSSGKTYTMQGEMEEEKTQGIIPRMISHVFKHIYKNEDTDFMIKVSMIEIYQEKIRDLFDVSRVNLNIREDSIKGIYVDGASERYVGCPNDVLVLLEIGSANRAQAATNMNEHSSRSHSIFILTINQTNKKEGFSKIGKLYLVDLAGSEKISKTGATGHTLEEAKIINKSLTTLGRVINNLTDGKSTHIPYRESKLTRVLQESLGGNSKTCLIITCSPSIYNESESLSTLRFGERAKKIKNKPKINKEITVAELQKLVTQLKDSLKKADARIVQLENFIRQNGLTVPESDYKQQEDEEEKKKQKEERDKARDEEKAIEEIKEKIKKEKLSISDRIGNTLNLLANDEDFTYDNRVEVLANLKYIKEQMDSKDFNNNNNNNQKNNNSSKDNSTVYSENSTLAIQGDALKYLNKIKEFKEVQDNPNLMKLVYGLQSQVKKITSNEGGQKGEGLEQSDDSLPRLRNYEDKDIQTEKLEEEYDKINEKFEREKRVLYKQIEDKTLIINNLTKDVEELEEKNRMMEDKIPFNEKKAFDMNMLLESNLRDLRKKLEESQVERLMLEDQHENYIKSMKDKNTLIANLEKEIMELKKNPDIKAPLPMVGNIIKKISGGKKN